MRKPNSPEQRTTTPRELGDLYRRFVIEKAFILAMIAMILLWLWNSR